MEKMYHTMTMNLVRQCPLSKSSELFLYTTICLISSRLNLNFRVIVYTDRQIDRQTDTQTDRHADNDEYSIVAVDKPQL